MTLQQIGPDALSDSAREFKFAIRAPATNGTYPVDMSALWGYDIVRADFQTDTGTITAVFNIKVSGGSFIPVVFDGGDSSLPLTSTAASEGRTSAYSIAVNALLQLTLSSAASSPLLASIDLYCRRT